MILTDLVFQPHAEDVVLSDKVNLFFRGSIVKSSLTGFDPPLIYFLPRFFVGVGLL